MKSLSRSVTIMFLFDLLILSITTYAVGSFLDFSFKLNIGVTVLTTLSGLIVLFLKGNYKIREFNLTSWNFYRLFEGVFLTNLLPVLMLLVLFSEKEIPLRFILIGKFALMNIFILYILLCLYRLCFHYYLFHIKKIKNILILGTDERARIIADEIQNKYALKMNVVGFVKETADDEELVSDNRFPVFTGLTSLKEIIKEQKIDIVVIAQPTELIMTVPRNVKLYKMPEFYEMATGKYYIDDKTITELFYQYVKHRSFIYRICKRIFDNIAAIIILVVTLPITAYVAIRVKLTDGESPFYTQTRVGKNGKTFECYKLRTMWANNYVPKEGQIKADTAGINDDRVIPWCRFVRKARFDEIPQMINILKGEMSIVGPRAEWEDLVKIYSKEIPFYTSRQWVRTGWTGWAQINQGHCVSNDDVTEKLQYDLYFLEHRNVLWEISILIKAVFMALGGRHE